MRNQTKTLIFAVTAAIAIAAVFHFRGSAQESSQFQDKLKLAKQGNPIAQYNVGVSYLEGNGISKDPEQALAWFYLAARERHPEAPFAIAKMYAGGQGIEEDLEAAEEWELYGKSLSFSQTAQEWFAKGYISKDEWMQSIESSIDHKKNTEMASQLLEEIADLKDFETQTEHKALIESVQTLPDSEIVEYLQGHKAKLLERKG